MRSSSAGSRERFNYNTDSVFADIPRMTQLLHMLRLNSLLRFFFSFFFFSPAFVFIELAYAHTRARAHTAVESTRHRPLQVLAFTLCWTPSAAPADNCFFFSPDDKHRVKVSEPSVFQRLLCILTRLLQQRHVRLSLWRSSPGFFFFSNPSFLFSLPLFPPFRFSPSTVSRPAL